jgi:enoyl-CoA hydratase/carnithine racemase
MFDGMAAVMQSEDATEGVRSFMERREAVFKGR